MELAPIVLFVYNRLSHTQQTVEALSRNKMAEESELFIFSDGPKSEEATQSVDKVREYIRTIRGFKNVMIREQTENLGLAESVISGVTEIVNRFGKIIVLEDDLVCSPYFLTYMNTALDKYRNDNQVMQISGYTFPAGLSPHGSAVFLPFSVTWGWGTWQRSWRYFDRNMRDFHRLEGNKSLRCKFNLDGSYPYFGMLEEQRNTNIDSWGIIWYLSVFMQNGMVLYPRMSLIQNIGNDGSGRHYSKTEVYKTEIWDKDIDNYPESFCVDREAYDKMVRFFKAIHPSPLKRFLKRIIHVMK